LSGGVFRHADAGRLAHVTETLRADPLLRPVLRTADIVVDRRYVLAPAGLLADTGHPAVADALLHNALPGGGTRAGQPEHGRPLHAHPR
jgi:hypothetical protein